MIGDALLSVFLIVVATVVRIDTAGYGDFSALVEVGPEMFPNIISWFLYIAAAAFLVKVFYKACVKKVNADGVSYMQIEREKVAAAKENMKANWKGVVGAVGVIVLMLLYAALLPTVGFEICTVVFMVGVMLLCGEHRPLRLIIIPLGTMFGVLLIFRVILKVALPLMIFTSL